MDFIHKTHKNDLNVVVRTHQDRVTYMKGLGQQNWSTYEMYESWKAVPHQSDYSESSRL